MTCPLAFFILCFCLDYTSGWRRLLEIFAYLHICIYGGVLLTFIFIFSATLLKETLHIICASLLGGAHIVMLFAKCVHMYLYFS